MNEITVDALLPRLEEQGAIVITARPGLAVVREGCTGTVCILNDNGGEIGVQAPNTDRMRRDIPTTWLSGPFVGPVTMTYRVLFAMRGEPIEWDADLDRME